MPCSPSSSASAGRCWWRRFVGWLAFWHGASALYASVITLVLPIVATQLLYSGGTFTGSSSGLSGFMSFDLSMEAWFWLAGSFLVLVTTAAYIFVKSDAGKLLVAVRENEQRCKYLGLDTSRLKILVYLACAAIAAIAGYIYAGYAMVVAPELAGFVFGTNSSSGPRSAGAARCSARCSAR